MTFAFAALRQSHNAAWRWHVKAAAEPVKQKIGSP
jgi:hypothetical protein